ncbi:hypothetical protein DL98DRAFT_251913 [Cadophora sp. DSE1049]|nr:hypothetical protein DL98DRAFT_251913 [Cadophora sp. DSE1049]
MTCRKLSRPTMSGLPCVRCIITDAPLYREQDAPFQLFSRRWQSMDIVDITEWASDEVRTIELTQVFLDEPVPYSVEVRRFVPAEGDMLEEKWSDGQVSKTHKIPPYGLADMKKTAQHMKRFLHDSIYMYILHTVGKVGSEELLWQTYLTAFQHSHEAPTEEERTLLDKCLFLWVACRKTSNPERICGADKLGVDPVEDPASPWFKHMPMPPVIIAQMECIIYTEILRPLSKAVLHRLQVLIKANKRTYWFTIYLTNFILLHSCSMLTRRDWEYARQMSLPTEFANPSSIKEHHLGAVKMLAHFHYINKGDLPFKSALTVNGLYEVSRDAGLSPSQSEFVRQTALMVKEKETMMREVRDAGNLGHDLYWISQLYEDKWKPSQTA